VGYSEERFAARLLDRVGEKSPVKVRLSQRPELGQNRTFSLLPGTVCRALTADQQSAGDGDLSSDLAVRHRPACRTTWNGSIAVTASGGFRQLRS